MGTVILVAATPQVTWASHRTSSLRLQHLGKDTALFGDRKGKSRRKCDPMGGEMIPEIFASVVRPEGLRRSEAGLAQFKDQVLLTDRL